MRSTFTPRARFSLCFVALTICIIGACTSTPTDTNIADRTANSNTAAPVAPQGTAAPTPAATVAAAQSDIPHPEIRRITVEETQALLAKNDAVMVDTRSASAYETAHVKGALNITGGDLEAKLKSLPRDKKIVTYCT